MCLSVVRSKPRKLTRRIETGYKGFYVRSVSNVYGYSNPIKTFLVTPVQCKRIKVGVWVKDKSKGMLPTGGSRDPKYRKGFHINLTWHGARGWARPFKVQFRGVVARGSQNGKEVVVAREIRILPGQI
jgi:hypothetical protein